MTRTLAPLILASKVLGAHIKTSMAFLAMMGTSAQKMTGAWMALALERSYPAMTETIAPLIIATRTLRVVAVCTTLTW
jgi:hypothetical protein